MVRWEITAGEDCTRVSLRDDLGIAGAGGLREALLEVVARGRAATVEFSDVTHIDTAAAQVLLAFGEVMRRCGQDVRWGPIPDSAREYLCLAGLLPHFTNTEVAEEAAR